MARQVPDMSQVTLQIRGIFVMILKIEAEEVGHLLHVTNNPQNIIPKLAKEYLFHACGTHKHMQMRWSASKHSNSGGGRPTLARNPCHTEVLTNAAGLPPIRTVWID